MIRTILAAAILVLSACSQAPSQSASDRVAVVAGAPALIHPNVPASAPSPVTVHANPADDRDKLLSVEESARIDTPEMRSEPIAADRDEPL